MSAPTPPQTVQVFVTCLVEALRPAIGVAVVRVLERLGVAVQVPEGQTCCGQPAFNAGAWDDARAMARYTVDVLERSDAPIVVPSGSCADMIGHRYADLLRDDPDYGPKAARVAARTHELSQLLVDVLGVKDVGSSARRAVAYHPSCHLLRGLNVRDAPQQLLNGVAGVCGVPLADADECCGFGGLFAFEMCDISSAMLDRKLDRVIQSGADTLVACDAGCLLQIEGGLRRRGAHIAVRHLAEILAEQP